MAERASSKIFKRIQDQNKALQEMGIAVNHLNTAMLLLHSSGQLDKEQGFVCTRAEFESAWKDAIEGKRIVTFKPEGDMLRIVVEDGAVVAARIAAGEAPLKGV